jgi:hypothetical protein
MAQLGFENDLDSTFFLKRLHEYWHDLFKVQGFVIFSQS